MDVTERRLKVHGLDFHVVEKGSGPAVLLLHGFPDTWYLWRHQIPDLVDSGFRVVVPDQRGFGESVQPAAVEAYQLPNLVNDILGILDELEIKRTHIVAHDWGASVGWLFAALYPDRVERFVPLSVGHPSIFTEFSIQQVEKSWYILLFQFEGVAEQLLMKNDWALLKEWSRHHNEYEKWIKDLSRPGALTAALNWYRANLAPGILPALPLQMPNIQVPTLGIWSSGDALLTEEQMIRSGEKVTGFWEYVRVEGASHWLQLDRPDIINKLLIEFLQNRLRA
ncbi:alpha/beta fold hydrolase [Parageobacillus thermoglucosidasius]|uniref:alpha/beta fold hydrolase n=1 Tax=Parageobacillus thermoglucosidasius TaxID=1426 RepID=UPI0021189439|nr:alpha/beta hydrolase [Parageobacillus thermoglucosidasius]